MTPGPFSVVMVVIPPHIRSPTAHEQAHSDPAVQAATSPAQRPSNWPACQDPAIMESPTRLALAFSRRDVVILYQASFADCATMQGRHFLTIPGWDARQPREGETKVHEEVI
jgi:hypothetical protein